MFVFLCFRKERKKEQDAQQGRGEKQNNKHTLEMNLHMQTRKWAASDRWESTTMKWGKTRRTGNNGHLKSFPRKTYKCAQAWKWGWRAVAFFCWRFYSWKGNTMTATAFLASGTVSVVWSSVVSLKITVMLREDRKRDPARKITRGTMPMCWRPSSYTKSGAHN